MNAGYVMCMLCLLCLRSRSCFFITISLPVPFQKIPSTFVMSSPTRPIEAIVVLSSISVVICALASIFYIPSPWVIATLVYHAIIGIESARTDRNEAESRLVAALAYVGDVLVNVWRSVFGANGVRLEDENEEEPGAEQSRKRLHPAAWWINIAVVCLLAVAWLTLLGLKIAVVVVRVRRRWWWDVRPVRFWAGLFVTLAEAVVLIAIAIVCKRMRNKTFAQIELGVANAPVVPALEGAESSTRRADDSESLVVLEP